MEWVIEATESILFNQPRIYKNIGYGKEMQSLQAQAEADIAAAEAREEEINDNGKCVP